MFIIISNKYSLLNKNGAEHKKRQFSKLRLFSVVLSCNENVSQQKWSRCFSVNSVLHHKFYLFNIQENIFLNNEELHWLGTSNSWILFYKINFFFYVIFPDKYSTISYIPGSYPPCLIRADFYHQPRSQAYKLGLEKIQSLKEYII